MSAFRSFMRNVPIDVAARAYDSDGVEPSQDDLDWAFEQVMGNAKPGSLFCQLANAVIKGGVSDTARAKLLKDMEEEIYQLAMARVRGDL